jgi:flavin reductase (DIM6/NTAB) family NADH-FMN oxidoreductase RutF
MHKIDLPPKLRFDFPTAVVVISCASGPARPPNLMTAGAITHACVEPPMLGVAVGHGRYTHSIISQADGFVVNVPARDQVELVDRCGSMSGREVDKFRVCGLTPLPSTAIASPGIAEFPINIECAMRTTVELGSHTFYFGEIVAVHCSPAILGSGGAIDPTRLVPLVTWLDSYWGLAKPVMKLGATLGRS